MTSIGAALVFTTREVNKKLFDTLLGFAAGVMIAASFWSLLLPAIEMMRDSGIPAWLPALTGFALGGLFLRLLDAVLPHLHIDFPVEEAEGIRTNWHRSMLLVLAITLHNIPEGIAVGVALGGAAREGTTAATLSAIALSLGIGVQDIPEGMAVSMPLRREGLSRLKSFWFGQLSGLVELLAGLAGAFTVAASKTLLPYALGFAAGAMLFVVVEEVIPESQRGGHTDLATFGTLTGFALMMLLDVALS
jgi:ZIP family zinc transporter